MRLTSERVVPASIEETWAVMLDVERVAPCLPGAAIEAAGDDEYRGTLAVRIGPIDSSFVGTLRVDEADGAEHRIVLSARGHDGRGRVTAAATITATLTAAHGGTRVGLETDLRMTGSVASLGQGVVKDVTDRLMREFMGCLASEMGPGATGGQGVALVSPLPPDVPKPPPTEAGVRWPAGTEPAAAEPAPAPAPARAWQAEGGLDLGALGRRALACHPLVRRVAPVAAGALGLLLVVVVLRRRSRE